MFGKKESALATLIGADSNFRGELQSKGTIRVDGIFEGNIHADWVIVGQSGLIRGNVTSRCAIVRGKVEGTIRSSEATEISTKGRVHGDIITKKLLIAEGAVFDGCSRMLADAVIGSAPQEALPPVQTASREVGI